MIGPHHDRLRQYPAEMRQHLVDHHGMNADTLDRLNSNNLDHHEWLNEVLHPTSHESTRRNPGSVEHTHEGNHLSHRTDAFHDLREHGITEDHLEEHHGINHEGMTPEQIVHAHRDDHDHGEELYSTDDEMAHGHPANPWPDGHIHHRFSQGQVSAVPPHDHGQDRRELAYADEHAPANPPHWKKEDEEGFVHWDGSGDSGGAQFSGGEGRRDDETFDAYMDRVINENDRHLAPVHMDGDYYHGDFTHSTPSGSDMYRRAPAGTSTHPGGPQAQPFDNPGMWRHSPCRTCGSDAHHTGQHTFPEPTDADHAAYVGDGIFCRDCVESGRVDHINDPSDPPGRISYGELHSKMPHGTSCDHCMTEITEPREHTLGECEHGDDCFDLHPEYGQGHVREDGMPLHDQVNIEHPWSMSGQNNGQILQNHLYAAHGDIDAHDVGTYDHEELERMHRGHHTNERQSLTTHDHPRNTP